MGGSQTEPGPVAPSEVPRWEDVVAQHSARVYRLAYRLTGNPHDAEDLTQEVFVRVFRSLPGYTPGTLRGMAAPDHHQPLPRPGPPPQPDPLRPLGDDEAKVPARGGHPDAAVADGMFDSDVEIALQSPPPDFRVAVVLCDIEGLSYEEIADVVGAKLGTVRSRIHRGRAMLRRALAHRAPARGRLRYSGPVDPVVRAGGSDASPRRARRLRRQRPRRRPARRRDRGPTVEPRRRAARLPSGGRDRDLDQAKGRGDSARRSSGEADGQPPAACRPRRSHGRPRRSSRNALLGGAVRRWSGPARSHSPCFGFAALSGVLPGVLPEGGPVADLTGSLAPTPSPGGSNCHPDARG